MSATYASMDPGMAFISTEDKVKITEPSICIPRTLNNITWRTVKTTFEKILGENSVERVDLINDRNGQPFCKVFIHLREWPNTQDGIYMRQRLQDGEMVKVVYDNPWFWKCSASRLPKPDRENKFTKIPFVEYEDPPKTPPVKTSGANSPPRLRRNSKTVRKLTGDGVEEASES